LREFEIGAFCICLGKILTRVVVQNTLKRETELTSQERQVNSKETFLLHTESHSASLILSRRCAGT
jgi:hypothetical protein